MLTHFGPTFNIYQVYKYLNDFHIRENQNNKSIELF